MKRLIFSLFDKKNEGVRIYFVTKTTDMNAAGSSYLLKLYRFNTRNPRGLFWFTGVDRYKVADWGQDEGDYAQQIAISQR